MSTCHVKVKGRGLVRKKRKGIIWDYCRVPSGFVVNGGRNFVPSSDDEQIQELNSVILFFIERKLQIGKYFENIGK